MANIRYLDINGQYVKGSPKVVLQNNDVISNEILNILTTTAKSTVSNGERVFEPTFGGGLYYYLYEPMDAQTASKMSFSIYNNLKVWMPHVEVLVNDIDVIPNLSKGYYNITIYWRDYATNEKGITKMKAHHAKILSPVNQ